MPDKKLYSSLKVEIDKIKVFDTHEHLVYPEEDYLGMKADFCRFLYWYTLDDLESSGLVFENLQEYKDSTGYLFRYNGKILDTDSKWKILKPYWENIRYTGYSHAALLSIEKLLGINDLNDKTYRMISEKLSDIIKPGIYKKIINEICGIKLILNDVSTMSTPGAIELMDKSLMKFVSRFREFTYVYKPGGLEKLEKTVGQNIRNIENLLEAMDIRFEQWKKEGVVALKIADAYIRDIEYEDSTRDEAERVFSRIFSLRKLPPVYDDTLSYREARPLENFILHRILERAEKQNFPVIIHTGIQTHMGNEVGNSKASLLTNLFIKYPKLRFHILHCGYPWMYETACLAKQFANVTLDLTWVHIIVPQGARDGLSHMLDMVPVNKIHAFGGDYGVPENIWGALEIARRNLTYVLAEKIEKGIMTENQAIDIAEKLLSKNAESIFEV